LGEQAAEEIHMTAFLATRRLLGGLDRLLHGRQQYSAILVDAGLIELRVIGEVGPQSIQRTTPDQGFESAFIDAFEVHSAAEVEQVLDRPTLAAAFDDGF